MEDAHSMQCSGRRGVCAMVHMGNVTRGAEPVAKCGTYALGAERKIDTDDPEHLQWLFRAALERSLQYNIQGVTYRLTQGVVKNIVPAIASTNAIVAGTTRVLSPCDTVRPGDLATWALANAGNAQPVARVLYLRSSRMR